MRREDLRISAGGAALAACWLRPAGAPGEDRCTLVLLHEGLGSIAQWRGFPQALVALTGCPALLYERRGHGASDPAPAPRTPAYLHDEARSQLPRVLEATGIERALLVGHSDGGSIALIHAADGNPRVAGIVTLAAHVFVEALTLAGIENAVHAFQSTDLPARLARFHGEGVEALFRAWSDVWRSPGFRDWNIEGLLGGIRCPVLALQGSEDQYGTPAQLESIARHAGGPVQVRLLRGAGHAPHLDQPQVVAGAIADLERSVRA